MKSPNAKIMYDREELSNTMSQRVFLQYPTIPPKREIIVLKFIWKSESFASITLSKIKVIPFQVALSLPPRTFSSFGNKTCLNELKYL